MSHRVDAGAASVPSVEASIGDHSPTDPPGGRHAHRSPSTPSRRRPFPAAALGPRLRRPRTPGRSRASRAPAATRWSATTALTQLRHERDEVEEFLEAHARRWSGPRDRAGARRERSARHRERDLIRTTTRSKPESVRAHSRYVHASPAETPSSTTLGAEPRIEPAAPEGPVPQGHQRRRHGDRGLEQRRRGADRPALQRARHQPLRLARPARPRLRDPRHLLEPPRRRPQRAAPRTPTRVGVDAFVEDAIAVLDDAGVDRCVVAGWSIGVNTAFELALRHPERVTGLFAVAGVPGGTFASMGAPLFIPRPLREPITVNVARLMKLAGPALTPVARRIPMGPMSTTVLRGTAASCSRPRSPQDVKRAVREFLTTPVDWYGHLAVAASEHQPGLALGDRTCPTAFVAGRLGHPRLPPRHAHAPPTGSRARPTSSSSARTSSRSSSPKAITRLLHELVDRTSTWLSQPRPRAAQPPERSVAAGRGTPPAPPRAARGDARSSSALTSAIRSGSAGRALARPAARPPPAARRTPRRPSLAGSSAATNSATPGSTDHGPWACAATTASANASRNSSTRRAVAALSVRCRVGGVAGEGHLRLDVPAAARSSRRRS